VGVITLPCSDCVTGHISTSGQCRIVETASKKQFTGSGLIGFLNSFAPPPVRNHISGDKAYKGLSAFVKVQWHRREEYGEIKFV